MQRVRAQSVPAEITVVSVLTMAKEEAEKAPDEESRMKLRNGVASSLKRTGQQAAFGTYVTDAANAATRHAALKAEQDETDKFNFEILANAKLAFLAGDIEEARYILRQCRPAWPPPYCSPAYSRGVYENGLFMLWEIQEGRSTAAWHRLRVAEWPAEMRVNTILFFGLYLAAGDPQKILEVRQLAEKAGGTSDSCIIKVPPRPGIRTVHALGRATEIRKLACNGEARAALNIAFSYSDITLRTHAILNIAEGLAGVPGTSYD
jgi:hypothetical protein